ncbi:MAG: DNA-directed RNA polymerase subunit N [Candidatus ainarchaeum sp.]|nr:DNA-directed RNA polymerase subunit N [Candidatus ainarchaeum sp.]
MEFPIRCFSCGSVIAQLYESYNELLKAGKSPKSALDELKIDKYCCRRMFLSHVDIMGDVAKYEKKD